MPAYSKIEPKGKMSIASEIAEIWQYRSVLKHFAIRDVILRYRQTFLGAVWVILQPLISSGLFAIIFGLFIRLPTEGENYFMFVLAAIVPWGLFSNTVNRSGPSLTQNINLITKVYFPRMIIPLGTSAAAVLDYVLNLLLLVLVALLVEGGLSARLLLLPVAFLLNLALAVGASFFISSLNAYYRDFGYTIPFLLQILFFASPIAYSPSFIPPEYTAIYYLNPLTGIIHLYRWMFLERVAFPPMALMIQTALLVALVLGIGTLVFKRVEERFADVI
jgi:lipopolysaccharide transport system permease protein